VRPVVCGGLAEAVSLRHDSLSEAKAQNHLGLAMRI
jgi:hypothetical protein